MALQTQTFAVGGTSSSELHYYALELVLTEQSTDLLENISLVDYILRLRSGSTSFSQYSIGASISLDGNVVATRSRTDDPQMSISSNSTLTILSGTATVEHDADGKKTMSIAFSIDMASASYTPGPVSVSGKSMVLTKIDRGLVHIDLGNAHGDFQAHIEDGTEYHLYAPHIDNGTGWDMCS